MITSKIWIYYLWMLFYMVISVNGNRERSLTTCITGQHDSNNPKTVRLVCSSDEMIRIKTVFMAAAEVPLQNAHNWCDFPGYDSNHCKAYEKQLTDEFSAACNTISVCSLKQYNTELPNCQPAFNPETATVKYIHVEYECLSRYDPLDSNKQIQFTQLYPQSTEMHTGSMLYLLSVDYPAMLPSDSKATCLISLPAHTHGSIKILNFDYTSSEQLSCPVRIDIPGQFICADPGTVQNAGFTLSPTDNQVNLPFFDIYLEITKDPRVEKLKIWLEASVLNLQGLYTYGMTVTCYGQQRQQPDIPPNPSITTTAALPSAPTPKNNDTEVNSQTATSKMEASTLYAIIGGAVAGILIIIIAIILVICFKRRRNAKEPETDLAYVCHANVSAAKRMGAEQNTYSETNPTIGVIEPYAKSGGAWTQEKNGDVSDTNNPYSDIDDQRFTRDSGQYAAIDISTPQPKSTPFSYTKISGASSDIGSSHSQDDNAYVVDSVTKNGTTASQLYSVPMKSRKLPLPPPQAAAEHVYAQPDKTKKLKLTSQSSAYSETQMVENDLYNF